MKKLCFATIIIILACIGTGIAFKQSAGDSGVSRIQNMEDIRELNCNVNQIFTEADVDLFIDDGRRLFDSLPETVEIYVVTPTDTVAQLNFTFFQEVKIIKPLRGAGMADEIVEIVTSGGFYDQKYKYHDYSNDRPLYYGMTNILLPGYEYLIFVQPLKVNEYTEKKRYNLATRIFGTYNITSDYSKPINRPAHEIAYNEYGDSEYLCDTYDTIEHLLKFKHSIVEKYLNSR